MDKIILTKEKETLLIPLFGKAMEIEKKFPIIIDKKAVEIVNRIDYNFASLKIPEKTNRLVCLRAKLIDNYVKNFLAENTRSAALHLGCGLDSRYDRIENDSVDWYDIDFQDVIDIRRHFYEETGHYHLIASSVTEYDWLKKIPDEKKECIVIAEGLFMYLKEEEIRALMSRLIDRLGSFTLIFDAFSVYTAKMVKNHPSLKKTGATIQWGIDHPEDLMNWGMKIQFLEEQYFSSNEEIKHLDTATRVMYQIANLFPIAKRAHRLLMYRVGSRL